MILLVAGGLALLPFVGSQINADGVSYLSIAQHYVEGRWQSAVNGYFGPLLSWLLVPFLATGLPPLVAAKAASLVVAAATLMATCRLMAVAEVPRRLMTPVAVALVPFLLYAAVSGIFPDLLLALLLLLYCAQVLPRGYREATTNGALAGLWAGFAFLAKLYALPFFVAHFTLMHLLHARDAGSGAARRGVAVNYVAGLAAFVLVAGPWVGIISAKYGQLTIGTSAGINVAYAALGSPGNAMQGHLGLVPPPNGQAISAWEDPTYLPTEPTKPTEPSADPAASTAAESVSSPPLSATIREALSDAAENVVLAAGLAARRWGVVTLLALGGFWLLARGALPPSRRFVLLGLLATVTVYVAGLVPLFVTERYLWFAMLAIVPAAATALPRLLQRAPAGRIRRGVAVALFAAVAVPALIGIDPRIYDPRNSHQIAARLGGVVEGNVASDRDWRESVYVCFHLGCRYYGVASEEISEQQLRAQMSRYSVDYYLAWDDQRAVTAPFLQPVDIEPDDGTPKVYRVRLTDGA